MKRCHKCKEYKPLSEFYTDRSRRDGHALICKECDKKKAKKYYQDHLVERREYFRRRYLDPDYRKGRKLAEKSVRERILELLGNKCVRCGFDDIRILQIDHVNGGGYQEMKKSRNLSQYYKQILEKIKEGSSDYQLLCPNCNWLKRVEKREYN